MTKLSGFASPSTIISRAFACQPHVHDAPALQAPDDDARHAWIIKQAKGLYFQRQKYGSSADDVH